MQATYFGMIWGGVCGIVGGVVGFCYGGPAGAAYGFSLGYSLGNLWGTFIGNTFFRDTPHLNMEPPPRPMENRVQTSTWGTAIPIQYGCGRMAGNVVYMSDIVETVNRSRHRQEGTRYYEMEQLYTCTFAVAFCEGPVENISRIWLNRKVFADYRNPLAPNYPVGDADMAYVNWETTIARSQVYFSIKLGTATQVADPSLAAILGAADTPAYRNLVYIVFKDFPIGEFQGLPTVEIEVNPAAHGNVLMYNNIWYNLTVNAGLSAEHITSINFPHPSNNWNATGGSLWNPIAITPAGDLVKIWQKSDYTEYRVYVFSGLSNTPRFWFNVNGLLPANAQPFGVMVEPTIGRFVVALDDGNYTRFNIFEADGTYVTYWRDTWAYNTAGGQSDMCVLANGQFVVIYRNCYLVYYAGYDLLAVYPSYLGGARVYPPDNNYRVGPMAHDNSGWLTDTTSPLWIVPPRPTPSDYIYAFRFGGSGYYKFQTADLIQGPLTNVYRIKLPASCWYPISPALHDINDRCDTIAMSNGFEVA